MHNGAAFWRGHYSSRCSIRQSEDSDGHQSSCLDKSHGLPPGYRALRPSVQASFSEVYTDHREHLLNPFGHNKGFPVESGLFPILDSMPDLPQYACAENRYYAAKLIR